MTANQTIPAPVSPAETTREHLRLLGIGYFVGAGMAALVGCIPIIHVVIGLLMITGKIDDHGKPAPVWVGAIFLCVGLMAMFLGWAFAGFLLIAGRILRRQRHYTFCFVAAVIVSLFMPLGTVLGVLTIVVLIKPETKALFHASPDVPAAT